MCVYIHIYIFTCCGPASLTMAVDQWKVQEFSSCSVHGAGCLSWFSVYTRTEEVASSWWRNGLASESKQAKNTSSLLPCPLFRLLPEGVAQKKGGSFNLKRLKVDLSISNDFSKEKNLAQVYPVTWILVNNSRYSQVDSQVITILYLEVCLLSASSQITTLRLNINYKLFGLLAYAYY